MERLVYVLRLRTAQEAMKACLIRVLECQRTCSNSEVRRFRPRSTDASLEGVAGFSEARSGRSILVPVRSQIEHPCCSSGSLAVAVLFGKRKCGRTQNNFVDNPNLNMIAYDSLTLCKQNIGHCTSCTVFEI